MDIYNNKVSCTRLWIFRTNYSTISFNRSLSILSLIILCFNLCSWVDPTTTNVYHGTLSGSGMYNGYQIEYYVNDSSHLALSESGTLINTDRYTISGSGKINNYEFKIRWDPDDGFQMQDGVNWISYDLHPDAVPAHFPFPVWIAFLAFLILTLVLLFSMFRGMAI